MLADVTLENNVLGTLQSHGSRGKGLSMREQAVLWAVSGHRLPYACSELCTLKDA